MEDMHPLFASIAKELLGANKPSGKGKVKDKVTVKDYTPEFEEWWAVYRKGNKANAFSAWKKQKVTLTEVLEPTKQYLAYCRDVDRALLDGQGFINQRAFETEWTHNAQGTSSGTKILEI